MTASYLVRLDDACPTMNWNNWQAIEVVLDRLAIRPIVGVIPDNLDPMLRYTSPDPSFWNRVRSWQRKGWTVALHGCHHIYHSIPNGSKSIIRFGNKSEFVGLSLKDQIYLVDRGYKILKSHGIIPKIFMAPSHSFDALTLRALFEATDIRVITDGISLSPFEDQGFIWIPQQLWHFRPMPLGQWTVCFHPNTMDVNGISLFEEQVVKFSNQISDFNSILSEPVRHKSIIDDVFYWFYHHALEMKKHLNNV